MGKPYYKQSHKAWYCNLDGTTRKLGKTEAEAFAAYARLIDPQAPAASPAPGPAVATSTAPSPAPVAGPTLAELVDKFCAHVKANCPPGTVKPYVRYSQKWATIHGSKPALSIIGADVTAAGDTLYPKVNDDPNRNGGRPYSNTARWQHAKIAKQVFVFAKGEGLIAFNPIEGYRSKAKCGKRDIDVTPEQFDRLLASCDDPLFRELLLCLYDTGARPQEIFNATAKHLDREHKCIRYAKGKGGRARVVYLTANDDRAFNILARLADQFPDGALLRNRIGSKWTIRTVDARLQVLDARTGVKATAYTFRHAFCTRHVKAGANLIDLQNWMGHSSIRMISEVYAHVGGDDKHLGDKLRSTAA